MVMMTQKNDLRSYDISDPKRRSRTHRVLKRAGLPIQYSVFTVVYNQKRLERLLAAIDQIIDAREDDVCCYVLPATVQCKTLGQQLFPAGVMLFSVGIDQIISSCFWLNSSA